MTKFDIFVLAFVEGSMLIRKRTKKLHYGILYLHTKNFKNIGIHNKNFEILAKSLLNVKW